MSDTGFHEHLIRQAEGRIEAEEAEIAPTPAAERGEEDPARGRPRRDDLPPMPYDLAGFMSILNMIGISVRRNVRTDSIELSAPNTDDKRWERADRFVTHHLYVQMRESARAPGDRAGRLWSPSKHLWEMLLHSIAMRNPYDEVLAWLNSLPPHVDREIDPWIIRDPQTLLEHLFGAPEKPEDLACMRYASRLLLGSVVHRTRDPGCLFKRVPVLVGDPGYGKSQLPALLMPIPEWASEIRLDIESDAGRRDQVEIMRLSVMACADELAGLRGDRVDAAKNTLTARKDTSSPKYERHAVTVPRRVAVHGNCNRNKKLPWDEGLQERMLLTVLPHRPARALEDTFDEDLLTALWSSVDWRVKNDEKWQHHGKGIPEDNVAVARSNDLYGQMLTDRGREMRSEWIADRARAANVEF